MLSMFSLSSESIISGRLVSISVLMRFGQCLRCSVLCDVYQIFRVQSVVVLMCVQIMFYMLKFCVVSVIDEMVKVVLCMSLGGIVWIVSILMLRCIVGSRLRFWMMRKRQRKCRILMVMIGLLLVQVCVIQGVVRKIVVVSVVFYVMSMSRQLLNCGFFCWLILVGMLRLWIWLMSRKRVLVQFQMFIFLGGMYCLRMVQVVRVIVMCRICDQVVVFVERVRFMW